MSYKVLTAFSPKMLGDGASVSFKVVSIDEVKGEPKGVGHEGAAQLLSQILGREVQVDRAPVTLTKGDRGYIVLANRRLNPGEELSAEELHSAVTVYYFEVS